MKRRQLFEFNDAVWVPAICKALVTDYLAALTEWLQPFTAQLPLMIRALRSRGAAAGVVDMCSGGGGPWRHLGRQLERLAGQPVPVVLTDIQPLGSAGATPGADAEITWHATPVDAMAVPPTLRGMRTLFNGFHHFAPLDAKHILRDAVVRNEPIIVMELLQRNIEGLLTALFAPLLV